MPRHLPPLIALRAFDAVARRGSLRAGAEDLSVHHTVVSRHVRKLESWLGVKLVDNSFSETRLTEAGKMFHERVSVGFDFITEATLTLRPSGGPELKLWCGPGLNRAWLMPRIEEISRTARVEIVLLRATDHLPDFRRFEADAAIHYGQEYIPYSNFVELFRPRMVPVASPGFILSHPDIHRPHDLLSATLLHEQSSDWWQKWFQANNVDAPANIPGPRLGYAHIAMEAAALGQGVALTNELMAASTLAEGRLVEIVHSEVYMESYFFYASKTRWHEPAISRLRQYLVENLSAPISAGSLTKTGGPA